MAIDCIPGSIGTSASLLCTVPPGVGSVTISVAAANTVFLYVGGNSGVTTTNGAAVVGGSSVTIHTFPGSTGGQLWAVASGAATPVGVFISTGS